jgi:hypothetical protein
MWADGRAAALAGLLAASLAQSTAGAAPAVPDRFTATTTAMTPRDVTLRIDVREWSAEAARTSVVDALEQASSAQQALASLPTVGHVWQSGSAVGYSLKYAHRVPTEGGERVTFVTDKRLGSYEFKPWTADGTAAQNDLPYSVIELYLPGDGNGGTGTLSLVADVQLDPAGALVSLAADSEAPRVLTNAKLEPKPYWAKEQED